MDIISVALKRHSTKAFDASKKLTPEQAEQIKTLLQYSPSSTNSQPWHFIVASTEEGKARVAKSAAGNYVFNERKILDASHVVVFCAKTAMDDAWLKLVVDQEDADGRFATPEAKAANDKGRKFFADMHRKDLHDDAEWMAKQVYRTSVTSCSAWRRWVWTRYPSKVLTPPSSMQNLVWKRRLHQSGGCSGRSSQR